jgi:hypothetical protein
VHWYLLGAIALGLALVLVHAIRARSDARLERAVGLFVAGAAIPIGGHLIYVAATAHEVKPFDTEERIYIVIGGVALIWVSVFAILRELGIVKSKT